VTAESRAVDQQAFRRLLGSFATGVTVVTALAPDGEPAGMTASAVAAVSLDPPLLLVCVAHEATFHRAMAGADQFVLNVLAEDQQAISDHFATQAEDKFQDTPHRRHDSGLPLLDSVVAHILCERWNTVEAGDHTVVFGRVVGGDVTDRDPLLHFMGQYRPAREPD